MQMLRTRYVFAVPSHLHSIDEFSVQQNGDTALMHAVLGAGNIEVVRLLLNASALVDAENDVSSLIYQFSLPYVSPQAVVGSGVQAGETPLTIAISHGDADIIKLMQASAIAISLDGAAAVRILHITPLPSLIATNILIFLPFLVGKNDKSEQKASKIQRLADGGRGRISRGCEAASEARCQCERQG
jgi:ankyrin repeat protein